MSHFKCGKTAYFQGAGLAACVHWPLNIANQFADSVVCFASVVDEEKKKSLREAGLKLLQLTVGYKLYIKFNAKPLVLFWKYLPHFPVANTMLWSGFGK